MKGAPCLIFHLRVMQDGVMEECKGGEPILRTQNRGPHRGGYDPQALCRPCLSIRCGQGTRSFIGGRLCVINAWMIGIAA